MIEPEKFLKPHSIPPEQRIWVVRAEGGHYFSHFRAGSIIALDHLSPLKFQDTNAHIFNPNFVELSERLKRAVSENDEHKASLTARLTQLHKFLFEMKPGDLVLTPGPSGDRVSFGRIVGQPRISNDPIIATPHVDVEPYEMRHPLQRKVIWGPIVRRNVFPVNVSRSLRANQTVYSADKHWQAIHHLLYPTFTRGGKVFVSLRINEQNDIDNYSVSTLLGFLTDLEVFCKFLDENPSEDFGVFFQEVLKRHSFDLKVKAQFMSEGDIDLSLLMDAIKHLTNVHTPTGPIGTLTYLVGAYILLFGNHKLGFDGVIDVETRRKLYDFFLRRWEDRGGNVIKDKLKLDAPDYDTQLLEDKSQDESGS